MPSSIGSYLALVVGAVLVFDLGRTAVRSVLGYISWLTQQVSHLGALRARRSLYSLNFTILSSIHEVPFPPASASMYA